MSHSPEDITKVKASDERNKATVGPASYSPKNPNNNKTDFLKGRSIGNS
jgi:hypothetical protein